MKDNDHNLYLVRLVTGEDILAELTIVYEKDTDIAEEIVMYQPLALRRFQDQNSQKMGIMFMPWFELVMVEDQNFSIAPEHVLTMTNALSEQFMETYYKHWEEFDKHLTDDEAEELEIDELAKEPSESDDDDDEWVPAPPPSKKDKPSFH